MALNKAKRELSMALGQVSTAGAVSNSFNMIEGASGTGSCTLSDTSLYTFSWKYDFNDIPAVSVSVETAGARVEVTPSTTGCTVRGYTYNGTSKKAIKFTIFAIGNSDSV